MFPIIDKPLIQYAVEEALAAGVQKLIFVTGPSKRAIENYFEADAELERFLSDSGKTDLLSTIRDIILKGVDCIYVR
jgi:UTP--glucose-1-phosphate uridylyltransferase